MITRLVIRIIALIFCMCLLKPYKEKFNVGYFFFGYWMALVIESIFQIADEHIDIDIH